MAMTSAMLDIAGIGKHYRQGHADQVAVLRDITLRVEEGTVLGLLGPNGAGKTTLIKVLAGLLRPDSGHGTVLGYDVLRQPAAIRARVSLVAPTADVGTDNNLTVRQNLAFWAPIYGLRGAQARARIDDLLARLDLVEKADAWPMHISAGQRQRLALARALLAENRLVFLDEPTNKLDIEGVRAVRDMIADLNSAHGVTIILTTHVMEEAEELCGEIALLRAGQLVTHQPTRILAQSLGLARPLTLTIRAPESPPVFWEGALAALPGVTHVHPGEQLPAGQFRIRLESLDLRSTTPALLDWVRASGVRLVSMRAEPITLTDVFTALTQTSVADTPTAKEPEDSANGGC